MTSQLPRFRCFFAAGSWERNTENGAAVTSLRSFLFLDNFSTISLVLYLSNSFGKIKCQLEQIIGMQKPAGTSQNLFWSSSLFFKDLYVVLLKDNYQRTIPTIHKVLNFMPYVSMEWLKFGINFGNRHSSISAVLVSAIFDLPRFITLSYFPPLQYY